MNNHSPGMTIKPTKRIYQYMAMLALLRSAVDMEELSRWESALSPKKLSLDPCEPDLREMAY